MNADSWAAIFLYNAHIVVCMHFSAAQLSVHQSLVLYILSAGHKAGCTFGGGGGGGGRVAEFLQITTDLLLPFATCVLTFTTATCVLIKEVFNKTKLTSVQRF